LAGLSGVAVTLDTARDNGPSTNFVGIATGSEDGKLIFAGLSGSDSVLTEAAPNQAGTVVYPVAERTSWLKVTFNAQLGGGTGANGLTFALLNPARSSASSVGGSGALVGFGGLPGVAVALMTYQAPGYRGNNFIGISAGASRTALKIQAAARAIPLLRSGTHEVTVRVIRCAGADVLVVWLDGEQVLQEPEPSLTATSLMAFTAGTGGVTDVHTVRDIAIASPG